MFASNSLRSPICNTSAKCSTVRDSDGKAKEFGSYQTHRSPQQYSGCGFCQGRDTTGCTDDGGRDTMGCTDGWSAIRRLELGDVDKLRVKL